MWVSLRSGLIDVGRKLAKNAPVPARANFQNFNHNRLLSVAAPRENPLVSRNESKDFMNVFPEIVRDLTKNQEEFDVSEASRRFAKVLEFNVPHGKKTRGYLTVAAYKLFEKPENLTPENFRLACVLGWCIELLQGFFLVHDDIMDGSETRRGLPCWYKIEDIGLSAINDGVLLEHSIYQLLKQNLSAYECYVPIVELFHDVTYKTLIGQTCDIMTARGGRPDLDLFTMTRYNTIVKYKSFFYSFKLPVAAAMYLANIYDGESHRQASLILEEMSHFFQIQDDFLDCYGDPEVTGKVGTDIREGKCSWLAVVALQRADKRQRRIMEEHYGNGLLESVVIVKKLYEELGLPKVFAAYEEESSNIIRTHVQQLTRNLPHELFFKLMEKLYKRSS